MGVCKALSSRECPQSKVSQSWIEALDPCGAVKKGVGLSSSKVKNLHKTDTKHLLWEGEQRGLV